MLRVNRETDYAIRILLALARRGDGMREATSVIQKEMLIPPALASRIVAELAQGGFIITFPGRDGGIQLAKPAADLNVLQVLEFFEGPIHVSECVNGKVVCPFEDRCPVRRQFTRLDGVIRRALAEVNFASLAAETDPLPGAITNLAAHS